RIFHILTSEDIDDVISRFCTVVCAKLPNAGWKWRAIRRFIKLTEVKIKAFTEEQESANAKKKTSYDLKLFKRASCLWKVRRREGNQEIPAAELQDFAIRNQ
ncbi:hypothetical protein ACROYT_G011244, partial [Oculina patagonica]